jgi:hypothetical protein
MIPKTVDTAVSAPIDIIHVDVEFQEQNREVVNSVAVEENATSGNNCRHCCNLISCLFIGVAATILAFSPTAGLTIAFFVLFSFAVVEVIKSMVVVVAVVVTVMEEVVVSTVRLCR